MLSPALWAPAALYPLLVVGAVRRGLPPPTAGARLAYNLALSAFSAAMCVLACKTLVREGRVGAACAEPRAPMPWYEAAWLASKYDEWADTLLLVAARKPLTRLHLLHHWSTVPVVQLQLMRPGGVRSPLFDAGVALNAFAHAWMYLYYAHPRACRPLRRAITSVQLAQHLIMLALVARSLAVRGCGRDPSGNLAVLGAYAFNAVEFGALLRRPAPRRVAPAGGDDDARAWGKGSKEV